MRLVSLSRLVQIIGYSLVLSVVCSIWISDVVADFKELQAVPSKQIRIKEKLDHLEHEFYRREIGDTYCYICLPKGYDPKKKYPVFLGFHGYASIPEEVIVWWAEEASRLGVILVGVKSKKRGWDKQDKQNVFNLLVKLEKNYSVDVSNVFIFGYSSGANFALYLGLNYPHKFKAIAAVAGSLLKADSYIGKTRLAKDDNKKLPVLLFIGMKDNSKRLECARTSKTIFQKNGYDFIYKEFTNMAHSYNSIYTNEISKWIKSMLNARNGKID